MMSKIIIEGPDRTGKTTLVHAMALKEEKNIHFPSGWYRDKLLNNEVNGTAATFLFFTETMTFWENPPEDFVLDRDILSMIVYQGILQNVMNPMIILNLYKSVVYKDNKPDKIIYLVNPPFEEYDMDDKFEAFGYAAIRTAYDKAFQLVEMNFPEIEMVRHFNEDYSEGQK